MGEEGVDALGKAFPAEGKGPGEAGPDEKGTH
jgi:hypothetical protein